MPLFTPPRAQYVDGNGDPLVGGLLFFYVTGTSTPKDTYTTSALSTPNLNPVVADANGIFPDIYLATDTDYKVILKTAANVTIWTVDPYFASLGTSRTEVADANYSATVNDRFIAYTSLTAARTVSLPAALLFPAGTRLTIVDESGSASPANLIKVAPNGTDTISGSNATQMGINRGYGRAELESNGSNAWFWLERDGTPVRRSYLAGLALSRTSATVLGVAAGTAADSTNALEMTFAAGSINCATTGANGLDTGSLANNTWYHAYGIIRPDGTTAFLASTSASAPTMPSGYTLKRRLGSFKTNGSAQIIAFTQAGDLFQWTTATLDVNGTAISGGLTSHTVNIPLGVATVWSGQLFINGTSGTGFLYFSVFAPGVTYVSTSPGLVATIDSDSGQAGAFAGALSNTSSQIASNSAGTGSAVGTISIATYGWEDRRGRDD